jgi:hypothetical protein
MQGYYFIEIGNNINFIRLWHREASQNCTAFHFNATSLNTIRNGWFKVLRKDQISLV